MSLLRTLSGSCLPLSAVPCRLGLQPDPDLRCPPLTLADTTAAALAPCGSTDSTGTIPPQGLHICSSAACLSTSPWLHHPLWDFIQMLPSLVVTQKVKNLPAMQEHFTQVFPLFTIFNSEASLGLGLEDEAGSPSSRSPTHQE